MHFPYNEIECVCKHNNTRVIFRYYINFIFVHERKNVFVTIEERLTLCVPKYQHKIIIMHFSDLTS